MESMETFWQVEMDQTTKQLLKLLKISLISPFSLSLTFGEWQKTNKEKLLGKQKQLLRQC